MQGRIGIKNVKTETCGEKRGRPMSSSGQLRAEEEEDEENDTFKLESG